MRINLTGWLFRGEGAHVAARIMLSSQASGGAAWVYLLMLRRPANKSSSSVILLVFTVPSDVAEDILHPENRPSSHIREDFRYPDDGEGGIFFRQITDGVSSLPRRRAEMKPQGAEEEFVVIDFDIEPGINRHRKLKQVYGLRSQFPYQVGFRRDFPSFDIKDIGEYFRAFC